LPSANGRQPAALAKVAAGLELDEDDVTELFGARGRDLGAVLDAADALRREVCGDEVTYVVTRNVNYTNVCYFRCGFCAFSKGKLAANLRGRPYLVPLDEIVRRAGEAWNRGAVELCLQGGIHPAFTGETYADICRAVSEELPDLHVHAFSALEIWQGAATLGLPLADYLERLRDLGLASLPGTAAEILDDGVRRILCPDKVTTSQWLEVHGTAHRLGLHSTTTIMYGSVEGPRSWARHLLELREQQVRTGGFTEFVPLPFVHMEAPIYLKGLARPGPTFREAILMHAVARLALHPHITNIQASWVKLGVEGAQAALRSGANDLGGTLMNESISRAAGAAHGQEMPPERMEGAIREIGRTPRQRTTLYGTPDPERTRLSFGAAPLSEALNPSVNDARLERPRRLVRPGLAVR
ncbi:MAG: 5-amino-6-(D-ribitylamino)uracil--L-tyrosine 4-hydroxyphenyl transferase CofH, partial [Candidatus Limnocylindria bacterium]